MRIKNIGKCMIVFNGGSLSVGKVAEFKGEAEKIGLSLLKAYPNKLLNLDEVKQEDIIVVSIPQEKEKLVEKKTTKAKTSKRKK